MHVRLEVEADEVAHLGQQRPEERLAGVCLLQVVLLVHLQRRAHARSRIVLQMAMSRHTAAYALAEGPERGTILG